MIAPSSSDRVYIEKPRLEGYKQKAKAEFFSSSMILIKDLLASYFIAYYMPRICNF